MNHGEREDELDLPGQITGSEIRRRGETRLDALEQAGPLRAAAQPE